MTTDREQWLPRLRDVFHGRPVRWAAPKHTVGDYEGRDRTLEVFNADAKDQRELLANLRSIRAELEAVAGGPIILIFHTTKESARLHADFVQATLQQEALENKTAAEQVLPSELEAIALALGDLLLQERKSDTPGATTLPRKAA